MSQLLSQLDRQQFLFELKNTYLYVENIERQLESYRFCIAMSELFSELNSVSSVKILACVFTDNIKMNKTHFKFGNESLIECEIEYMNGKLYFFDTSGNSIRTQYNTAEERIIISELKFQPGEKKKHSFVCEEISAAQLFSDSILLKSPVNASIIQHIEPVQNLPVIVDNSQNNVGKNSPIITITIPQDNFCAQIAIPTQQISEVVQSQVQPQPAPQEVSQPVPQEVSQPAPQETVQSTSHEVPQQGQPDVAQPVQKELPKEDEKITISIPTEEQISLSTPQPTLQVTPQESVTEIKETKETTETTEKKEEKIVINLNSEIQSAISETDLSSRCCSLEDIAGPTVTETN